MEIKIDPERCKGHGVCCSSAPDLFFLGDDDRGHVVQPQVPTGLEEHALMAAGNCPEQAIQTS